MALHENPLLKGIIESLGEGRFVGGAVRDALLGIQSYDVDIATPLTPQEVMNKLPGRQFHKTRGISHGTVSFTKKPWKIDITTLRKDVATDGRHAQVKFTSDWRLDASRRDFTINAIYMDKDGELFDPTGGIGDLKARRVIFIGDPAERIREDYLRIFRFLRFSARFSQRLHPEGWKACLENMDGIDRLSGERIWQELSKTFPPPGWICPHLEVVLEKILQRKISVKPRSELDQVLFLATLVSNRDELDQVAHRLRLSRAEKRRIGNASINPVMSQQGYEDRNLLRSGAKTEAAPFPIKGKDLAPFKAKGPCLGEGLKKARLWWFSHKDRFPSKDEATAKLTSLLQEEET